MTPADLLLLTVRPVLAWMGAGFASPEAEVMLLAIQPQEDRACARCQAGGPARGLWQMEVAGLRGVAGHPRSGRTAYRVLEEFGAPSDPGAAVEVLRFNDQLACALARLLLCTDPHPLPAVGDRDRAWDLYLRLWRPGRPRPDDWPASYASALAARSAAEPWRPPSIAVAAGAS